MLAMKQQKPIFLLSGRREPMHQAANTVITMAGHSSNPIQYSMKPYPATFLMTEDGCLPAS
ncbi:hypothetical protein ABI582_23160 [Pseudomonas sp. SAS7]|uniref:hypothetical protein n=1 Tax=Pseudomonas sp. SAS7 TaxID=3156487 RepID=UPI003F9C5CAB